jgi:hypothetical protein
MIATTSIVRRHLSWVKHDGCTGVAECTTNPQAFRSRICCCRRPKERSGRTRTRSWKGSGQGCRGGFLQRYVSALYENMDCADIQLSCRWTQSTDMKEEHSGDRVKSCSLNLHRPKCLFAHDHQVRAICILGTRCLDGHFENTSVSLSTGC